MLTLGYSPITAAEFAHTAQGSGRKNGFARVLVPSHDCLVHFSRVILESSVHVTADLSIVFLQTILR